MQTSCRSLRIHHRPLTRWYVCEHATARRPTPKLAPSQVGRHYSHTLRAWYNNWMKNKDDPNKKEMDDPAKRSLKEVYGGVWTGDAQLPHVPGNLYRLWDIFLAWSTVAAGIVLKAQSEAAWQSQLGSELSREQAEP